jgi:MoaA/NifB/PqqE/SkfB family radical SAM enzyme
LHREAVEVARRVGALLERPRCGWPERRRRLRSYATAAGNYVTNRRRARAGRGDLLPLYFIWTLLRTCNFRCEYCDDHRGQRYPELPKAGALPTDQSVRLLRIMRTRTPSVYFSGGEPLLRKDLPHLTRQARDLDYYPIVINTNGSIVDRLLELPDWRTWLADTDVVVVSLDGLDLEVLRDMWRYPHPERVIRNLLLLRELARDFRVKLMVNTVIQPGLVDHARDVLDFVNDLGIWFCPVPMNTGPTIHQTLRDDPQYLALAELILERKRCGYRISGSERLLRRLLWSEALTCYNTLKPHVDHDGALFWPCKASVNVAPVRIDVLHFTDVDALYAHAASLVDPAGFHGAGPNQCGANCNWAQNYTTDAYAHGLLHPSSLLTDVAEFLRLR